MSVLVPRTNFNDNVAAWLDQQLTVQSIIPQKFNMSSQQRMQMQNSQKVLRAYDVLHENGKQFVSIPFSFYYHHCSNIKRVPLIAFEQKKMKFEGQLLPRQIDIKEETLEILSRTNSVLLSLHTGFGKTIFTLYLLSRIGMKALVLCHRSIIIQQWLESVAKYLPSLKVDVLSTTKIKQNVHYYDDNDILIANVTLINDIDRSVFASFGTLIIDEAHTICTPECSKALYKLFPAYLIGLSATPFRTDGLDKILELYVGPEMVIRKMTRYFNAYRLNTKFEPKAKSTVDGKLDWNSVLESQAIDNERNILICRLVWYFDKRNILILVKRTEHALQLKNMLITLGQDCDCFMKNAKKVNYDCRVLIATYSKGGVGFDHPKLDMLIAGADVEESFMQYLGRVFRRDDQQPIYIDLRDKMKSMESHSRTRLNICKETGANVLDFYKNFSNFDVLTEWIFDVFANEGVSKN